MKGEAVVADVAAAGCTSRYRFQIASVSKQFTAAAVLLLAQRGALELDDRIGRWIGGCPPSSRDITLHHLLAHTSGLGHWHDCPMIDLACRIDPDELLKMFHRVSPLFVPGVKGSSIRIRPSRQSAARLHIGPEAGSGLASGP